jgi:hypothetical protein
LEVLRGASTETVEVAAVEKDVKVGTEKIVILDMGMPGGCQTVKPVEEAGQAMQIARGMALKLQ